MTLSLKKLNLFLYNNVLAEDLLTFANRLKVKG